MVTKVHAIVAEIHYDGDNAFKMLTFFFFFSSINACRSRWGKLWQHWPRNCTKNGKNFMIKIHINRIDRTSR